MYLIERLENAPLSAAEQALITEMTHLAEQVTELTNRVKRLEAVLYMTPQYTEPKANVGV